MIRPLLVAAVIACIPALSTDQHLTEGAAQSPVRVIIYEDLQCPDCAVFRDMLDREPMIDQRHQDVAERMDPFEGASVHERARIALDESAALTERCSKEIRSLSYLLHPPLLEEVGLPSALRWCAEGFGRRSGISVDLDLPAEFGRLPVEMENALFRVVQECLTNIHRHSGSASAWIRLVRNPGEVILEVRDEGHGLPEEVLRKHGGVEFLGVGLLGMRERIRQLGGRMQIDSGEGGATIRVELPMAADGV